MDMGNGEGEREIYCTWEKITKIKGLGMDNGDRALTRR